MAVKVEEKNKKEKVVKVKTIKETKAKKENKKEKTKKSAKKGRFHCTRCHKDRVKLYSWKGFHFCVDCKTELNSGKAK